jgi:hypothetical protein
VHRSAGAFEEAAEHEPVHADEHEPLGTAGRTRHRADVLGPEPPVANQGKGLFPGSDPYGFQFRLLLNRVAATMAATGSSSSLPRIPGASPPMHLSTPNDPAIDSFPFGPVVHSGRIICIRLKEATRFLRRLETGPDCLLQKPWIESLGVFRKTGVFHKIAPAIL